jgi:hypothetical protein
MFNYLYNVWSRFYNFVKDSEILEYNLETGTRWDEYDSD